MTTDADQDIEAKVKQLFEYKGSPRYFVDSAWRDDPSDYDHWSDGLIDLGAPAVPQLLERYAKDPQELGLAHILGQIGDPRAVQPLLDQLRKSPHPESETAIIAALGEIGDPRGIDDLVAIARIRKDTYALSALAQIDHPRALEAITEIVNNPRTSKTLRVQAARVLKNFPIAKSRDSRHSR